MARAFSRDLRQRAVDRVQAGETVLIAHSLGVFATDHAAPRLAGKLAAAFLVGPSDWELEELLPGVTHDFAPVPLTPLPFPSVMVASRNDPYCDFDRAEAFAKA